MCCIIIVFVVVVSVSVVVVSVVLLSRLFCAVFFSPNHGEQRSVRVSAEFLAHDNIDVVVVVFFIIIFFFFFVVVVVVVVVVFFFSDSNPLPPALFTGCRARHSFARLRYNCFVSQSDDRETTTT